MRSLLLLGSTGSIGKQTLDLLREQPGSHRVVGLAARRSADALREQVAEFSPAFVALADEEAAEKLRPHLQPGTKLFSGPRALEEIALEADYDVALHGVVGAAGLPASIRVLERGRTLALANKESLVMAGARLVALSRERGGSIIPVDSEHSAILPVPARRAPGPRAEGDPAPRAAVPFRAATPRRSSARRPRRRCGTRTGAWGRGSPSARPR
jgi:1-deoxy-D-xylulose-5-phosphate reductoisomerase